MKDLCMQIISKQAEYASRLYGNTDGMCLGLSDEMLGELCRELENTLLYPTHGVLVQYQQFHGMRIILCEGLKPREFLIGNVCTATTPKSPESVDAPS